MARSYFSEAQVGITLRNSGGKNYFNLSWNYMAIWSKVPRVALIWFFSKQIIKKIYVLQNNCLFLRERGLLHHHISLKHRWVLHDLRLMVVNVLVSHKIKRLKWVTDLRLMSINAHFTQLFGFSLKFYKLCHTLKFPKSERE